MFRCSSTPRWPRVGNDSKHSHRARRQGGMRLGRAEPFGALDDPALAATGTPIVEGQPPGELRESRRFDHQARHARSRRRAADVQ